jgi:hypothetical protein
MIEYKHNPDPGLLPRKVSKLRPSDAIAIRNVILGIVISMEESGADAKALENAYKHIVKDKYGWLDAKSVTVEEVFNELVGWLKREFGQPDKDAQERYAWAKLQRIIAIVEE